MNNAATSWFFDTVESTALEPATGSVALVERAGPAGAMAPLHRRDEDESYRVVEGAVTFLVDDDLVVARPGDVVVAPAGTARTFRIDEPGTRWLVLTRVDSLTRFEDFGRALAQPVDDGRWSSAEELAVVQAIGAANGIEILGPPGIVPAHVLA